MEQLNRLLPYLYPNRRKLYLVVFLALVIACAWVMNLSAAFPLVKVLLQKQTVVQYVDQEIADTEQEIQKTEERLKNPDEALPENQQLAARAEQQGGLSEASSKLVLLRWVRQNIVPLVPGDQFDTLALLFLLVLVSTAFKGLCIFLQDTTMQSVVESTVIHIREDLFNHILSLDYQTVSHEGTGQLLARVTNDVNEIAMGLNLMGGRVIREPLKALTCLIAAFWINWQLMALSFVFVPVTAVVFYRIGRKLKQASHRQLESVIQIYKTLEETFESIKIVFAFNSQSQRREKLARANQACYSKVMKIARIDAMTNPITELLGIALVLVSILPGAYLVLRDTTKIWGITLASDPMDIAQLSLLYVFLLGLIDPLRKMSNVYAKVKRATAAGERVFAMLDRPSLVEEPETPRPLPRHAESIEFVDVEFRYRTANTDESLRPLALKGVNLSVQAGEVIVLVGENGSGKSTLINLLPRFFEPDQGSILIDDIPVRDVSLTGLRNQIGLVSQETILFDDTIYENIRYGNPQATSEEVENAAEQAYVCQFTSRLPDGLQTLAGEKGKRLSGGQRQRVALARAILRNPAILILDEATSAIDAQSETLIHKSLQEFTKGRTTFIITHSIGQGLLDLQPRIVVMHQGQIAAIGDHQTLAQTCPVYQGLFQSPRQRKTA